MKFLFPSRACHRVLGALAVLAAIARLAVAAEDSCITCHEHQKQREAFLNSAHAQAGVTCRDCHGGDGKLKDETAHTAAGFQRPDNKKAIAAMCARCHSDVRRMNPYGLPTDQLDRYKTSKHGEQLFGKNDQKVAVCTDCHGVHDILKAKSPQSRVYPTNIPATCGRCHSDAKLMAEYKLPADVVAQYKTSYHAHMVFAKGDLSAPTCVTCHGNHGAVPPGAVQVGQVCGKCHVRQRELFEKSVHAELAKNDLFKECVSCHGNHAIQRATPALFATACSQCHRPGETKPFEVRDRVAGLLRQAGEACAAATERVRLATVLGLATDDEQLVLQQAGTQLKQLDVLQHSLSPETVAPVAKQAGELAAQTLASVAELERRERLKRLALAPVGLFLSGIALLCWLKRRQIEREEKQ
ncbi:MAG: cytochrome c3 family protein [Verrucomicrobia bacterium]|nr:cytochrome c3 family protein [Verrucomicrobiota bacterium]